MQQFTINNTLAITAGPEELERINQLLLLVDADPFLNQGIRIYPLENADAIEVAEELAAILQLIEGELPSYQVRGIARINALLVTAPATRGFDEVSRWVAILDAESQQQVEQLFMYRVKNLPALELASTLSQVFEEEEEPALPGLQGESDLSAIEQQVNLDLVDNSDEDGEAEAGDEDDGAGSAPAAETGAPTGVSANLQVRIVADEATNALLIRASARDYRQLLTTISQLDVAPLQVMVNAVIAQITLNDETRFGVDWSRVAENAELVPVANTVETSFRADAQRPDVHPQFSRRRGPGRGNPGSHRPQQRSAPARAAFAARFQQPGRRNPDRRRSSHRGRAVDQHRRPRHHQYPVPPHRHRALHHAPDQRGRRGDTDHSPGAVLGGQRGGGREQQSGVQQPGNQHHGGW